MIESKSTRTSNTESQHITRW